MTTMAAKGNEKLLLVLTLGMLAFGLVMLYSASSVLAMESRGDGAFFVKRQFLWTLFGLCAMWLMWKTDYRRLRPLLLPLLLLCTLGLVLVLVPGVGAEINGSKRWIRIAGMSLQPSEFVKVALYAFLAASLAKRHERMGEFVGGLVPYLVIIGVVLTLIVAEPDLGTAIAVAAVSIVMLYFAGAKLRHLALLALPALPVMYVQLFMVGFRKGRLAAYIDPWSDRFGAGFQTIQSFLAFSAGGLTGRGLGESTQKLLFLPEPHSDFIFAVIGEELGLVGTLAVLCAFIVFTLSGFKVALGCRDGFGRMLAFGLTLMVAFQAFVNMSVTTGLIPNSGMPLPFVSAGGSSLFVTLLSVGLVMSVARVSRQEPSAGPADAQSH